MSIFKHTFRMTSSPHERWNIASNASHFRIVVTGNKLLNNISISLQKKKKQIELMTILKGVRLTHEVLCEAGRCFVWVTQRIKKIIALCLCCSLLLSPVCQVDA